MLYMQIKLLEESLGWHLKASSALEDMKNQTISWSIHDWRLKTLAELHLQIKAIEESLGWHLLGISVLEDESSISSCRDCVEPDDPGFFYGEDYLDNPDITISC